MDAQQVGNIVGQLLADNIGNRITVPLADGIVLHVMRAINRAQPVPFPQGGDGEPDSLPT